MRFLYALYRHDRIFYLDKKINLKMIFFCKTSNLQCAYACEYMM